MRLPENSVRSRGEREMGWGRGMAAKGKKRSRNGLPPAAEAVTVAGDGKDGPEKAGGGGKDGLEKAGGAGGFFCCYLLRSLCPRSKSRTYIGFTVNPRGRIRQHNGEIRCGAWRTKRGRPWEMVLCIHGFPTNVAALQFEWAWQHPTESLAVRKAAAGFKSLGGIGNKVKIAYTMLNLPSWENLNLTVNFFSTKNTKFTAGCPALPCHMKAVVSPMEDLPCYDKGIPSDEDKEPREDEEPVGGDHGLRPLDLEMGATFGESDIDELAPVQWNGVFGSIISESSAPGPQPVEEETGIADCDAGYPIDNLGYMESSRSPIDDDLGYMDWSRSPIADLGYMEWSRSPIHETSELHESRSSPRCSASSCSDDVSRKSVDCVSGQVSPVSKAGPDDDGSNSFHITDVVDMVTPVGRFARDCSKAASIWPKIIDLTDSPTVIEL